MKIKTIRFTTAFPTIGQQFDQSDAENINVVMNSHCVVIDADRTSGNPPVKTHFRLYVPWTQISFIREDV